MSKKSEKERLLQQPVPDNIKFMFMFHYPETRGA